MTSEDKYDDLDSTATLIVKAIELINFYIGELVKEYPTKKQVVAELLRLIKTYLESSFSLLEFYVKDEVDTYVK